MADYSGSTDVSAPPGSLFDYLSDIGNLPDYFSRMRSASARDGGEAVQTVAQGPDGQTVEGEAWFRVDQQRQRIEWGSEGPSDYSGHLEVTPAGDGSRVQVHLSTSRVESEQVQQGVDETVTTIKQKVEQQGAGQP